MTDITIQKYTYSSKKASLCKQLWNQRYLYLFVLPGVVWFLIFCYRPMYGVLIAFKDYDIVVGVLKSPWIGFKHFTDFFYDPNFNSLMTNTIGISLLKILFGFPAPIALALMINEIRNVSFKKLTQTISYLPYFISWVVVAGIWYELFKVDDGGLVNTLLMKIGLIKEPVFWFGEQKYFWGMAVVSDIWKNIGWSSIIYLAALSGIDVQMYEAATIDGASKFQQTLHITLPGIRPTIVVLFIYSIGGILNAGFDQIYVMQNAAVMDRAQIIDTYVMQTGIFNANYSIATAIGLFKSVVGLILLFMTNAFVKLMGEEGII